jgi:hypothetical protein
MKSTAHPSLGVRRPLHNRRMPCLTPKCVSDCDFINAFNNLSEKFAIIVVIIYIEYFHYIKSKDKTGRNKFLRLKIGSALDCNNH